MKGICVSCGKLGDRKVLTNGLVQCDCQKGLRRIETLHVHTCSTFFEFIDWLCRSERAGHEIEPCGGGDEIGFVNVTQKRVWAISLIHYRTTRDDPRIARLAKFYGLTHEALVANFGTASFRNHLLTANTPPPTDRLPTGVEPLDKIMAGGFPKGKLTMLAGTYQSSSSS